MTSPIVTQNKDSLRLFTKLDGEPGSLIKPRSTDTFTLITLPKGRKRILLGQQLPLSIIPHDDARRR